MNELTNEHGLSFDTYCAVHRPAALKLATRLSKSSAQAEDIVQDAMIRAFRFWGKFKPGDNPLVVAKRWLLHIVTNQFINTCNKKTRDRKQLSHIANVMIGTYGQQEDGRDPRQALSDGVGDEVEEALKHLGPEFLEVARRYALEDKSYSEISEELGIPMGTVMSRLFRARKTLKPLLTRYAQEWYRIDNG